MEIGCQRECIKRYTNYNDTRHVIEGRMHVSRVIVICISFNAFSLASYFHSTLYHVSRVIVICISFNAVSLASYFHSTLYHVPQEIGCQRECIKRYTNYNDMRHVVEGRMEIGYQRECIKRYTNYNDMRHVVEGRMEIGCQRECIKRYTFVYRLMHSLWHPISIRPSTTCLMSL
jgi:hypothetical protein